MSAHKVSITGEVYCNSSVLVWAINTNKLFMLAVLDSHLNKQALCAMLYALQMVHGTFIWSVKSVAASG